MRFSNQISETFALTDHVKWEDRWRTFYSDCLKNDVRVNSVLQDKFYGGGLIQVSQNNSSIENEINVNKLNDLKNRFTHQLISYILEEDFDYGVESKACLLVKQQMDINALVAKEWINDVYINNFNKPDVLIGLLQIISRLDRREISPEGETIALASLVHKDEIVQECAIRVFESWGEQSSLNILEHVQVSTPWIKDYLEEVISDLKFKYVGQKNNKIEVVSK